jgi:AraC-like DNA-binding protein
MYAGVWKGVPMERIKRFDGDCMYLTHGASDEPYYRAHHHDEYEIFYVREGDSIIRRIDGREYTIHPGGLLLIPPKVFHDHRILSSQPYDHLSIHFLPDMLDKKERSLFQHLFDPGQAYYVDPSGTAGFFADSLLECMGMDKQIRTIAFKARIISLLTHLYGLRDVSCVASQRVLQNKRMQHILDFIFDNLRNPVSLDALSQRFNINKNHLNVLFRKEIGTTAERYIRIQRLYIVRQNIGSGMGITEAAYDMGFNDYSNFFRAYKTFFGCAPTAETSSHRSINK